ncbi:MAG: Nif11-like leader peptide family natural product precursor [Eubacteriales bacterium SKADARSKE-1]|nr:Nif11-like leader peptide family natural product precursor [Eubacteriales bacterium SKADARSKE-1]
MKGIMEWAKDLKHNEKVAEKFTGVKTVGDILSVAKKNGYEFTENELMDLDLDSVSGGLFGPKMRIGTGDISVDIDVATAVANVASTVTGSGSASDVKPTINISQKM